MKLKQVPYSLDPKIDLALNSKATQQTTMIYKDFGAIILSVINAHVREQDHKVADVSVHHSVAVNVSNKDNDRDLILHQKVMRVILVTILKKCRNLTEKKLNINQQLQKQIKKLYLDNLPPNITSQKLMDMLNVALKKMNINKDVEGDSIISAWISPDVAGHLVFVEFRTAQKASNGLALNGASLFGYQLKFDCLKKQFEYNKQMLSKYERIQRLYRKIWKNNFQNRFFEFFAIL